MRNVFIGFLIVAAIVVGGGFIAKAAYQAGLSTAITTAAANAPDGTVVTPVAPGAYPYGYGYGYGHGPGWGGGFSIFGFLGALLFFLSCSSACCAPRSGAVRGWGGRRRLRRSGGPGPGQLGRPRPPQSVPGDVRRLASPGARTSRPRSDDPAEGPVGLSRPIGRHRALPVRPGRAHPCRYDAARHEPHHPRRR